jgi:hypothetical protein
MATIRWLAMPTRAGVPAAGGRVGQAVERAWSGGGMEQFAAR